MPRPAVKVQRASRNTQWTLDTRSYSPTIREVGGDKMQANGFHFDYEPTPPQSDEYEGLMSQQYDRSQLGHAVSGSVHYGNYDDNSYYGTQRQGQRLSINTDTRPRPQPQDHDAIAQHMLYETALLDTQAYEILRIEEVDQLKKEQDRLTSRIEATQRKLALETKVKHAAQNLSRLYQSKRQSRPDTPQSPGSPKKSRSSLLGSRRMSSSSVGGNDKSLTQAEDELAASTKKVEELAETYRELLERRQEVESKLLRHTAAVLAVQSQSAQEQREHSVQNRGADDDDGSMYSPDAFDGIRDILVGQEAGSLNKLRKRVTAAQLQQEHEQNLTNVQTRVEQLNYLMRSVIGEVTRSRGAPPRPDYSFDEDADAKVRLNQHIDRLGQNIQILQQEQHETHLHHADSLSASEQRKQTLLEDHLSQVNQQIHRILIQSQSPVAAELGGPPQMAGKGYEAQTRYLQNALSALEEAGIGGDSRELEEAQTHASTHARRADEYESTIFGLWEHLSADGLARSPSMDASMDGEASLKSTPTLPSSPFREPYSLHAFNSKVQQLVTRVNNAKEQHDILRRQIQQQRELNGKSDAEKDRQFADLQTQHESLTDEHAALQETYTKVAAQHTQSDAEASQLRAELLNVENEIEQIKRNAEVKHQEREEMAQHLGGAKAEIRALETQIADLEDNNRVTSAETEARAAEVEERAKEADEKHTAVLKDMANMEAEVVRLTTELTMAKAELEGAYGSRAERAREAQAAEVEQVTAELATLKSQHSSLQDHATNLRSVHEELQAEAALLREKAGASDRVAILEQELEEITNEFQDMTRESLEMEREREQLENLIDGLRDRCDVLEGQLSDEKVRSMGMNSPGGADGSNGRELMSTTVLRNEFKKMIRESRMEGVKLLRAEQEERRKLEAELRHLRRSTGGSATMPQKPGTPNGLVRSDTPTTS